MIGKGLMHSVAFAVAIALSSSGVAAKTTHSDAIIGGDRTAIIGGDRNAIIGGDARKLQRSDAIIGGDRTAIIGGDRNAIIGGDARKLQRSDAVIGGDILSKALVIGPIEDIDLQTGKIMILGQRFESKANVATLSKWRSTLLSGTQSLAAVLGKVSKSGGLEAGSLLKISDQYVAGATRVMIRGKVSNANSATGQITVGKAVIDASAFITRDLSIVAGKTVTIMGTQPVLAGVILAESLTVR